MDSSKIVAYVLTVSALLICAAVLIMRFVWKWARKRVYEIPSKIAARSIFSSTHLVPVLLLLVCFGYFQPWNLYIEVNESKLHVKREIEILDKKADTASQMLPGTDKIVIPDAVRDAMLDSAEIGKAIHNEMHVDLPGYPILQSFIDAESKFQKEVNKGSFCNALKNEVASHRVKTDFLYSTLSAINSEANDFYSSPLNILLQNKEANNKNEFKQGITDMDKYSETIKTKLIKLWKESLVQFGKSIDMRMNKILVTILVTDILLLYIPSALVLIYIVFSIIIWTKKDTSINRNLLLVSQVLIFVIAIYLIACSIHSFVVHSDECSIDEDKTVYFNFDIPTRNGGTKNSHKILSTCSSNLFDSPNDDILFGKFGFSKNLKTLILNEMLKLKEKYYTTPQIKSKLEDIILTNWDIKKLDYGRLSKLLEDDECKSSKSLVDGIMKEFDAIVNKTDDYIAALVQRGKHWDNLETNVELAVDKHVQRSGGILTTQVNKINDGIKILNVDCQTTRTLFSKVNQTQCSNNIGFVALQRSIVLFALGTCMIYFLFTYRKFGPTYETPPQQPAKKEYVKGSTIIKYIKGSLRIVYQNEDKRGEWAKKIAKTILKNLKTVFIHCVRVAETDVKYFNLKDALGKSKFDTACVNETRVVLKNGTTVQDGFIHANIVTMPDKSKYIATIAPLDSSEENGILDTKPDFWEMVWQEKVEVIVMLCQLIENGKVRCSTYFPQKKNEKVTFGNYIIELVEVKDSKMENVCWRQLEVTCSKDGKSETRVVNHVQYMGWPDFGIPEDLMTIVNLLDFVKDFKSVNPIIVHCVAGVGRTGCFLTIEYANQELKTETNLADLLEKVRDMRAESVQSSIQFVFVHACLLKYFEKQSLIDSSALVKFYDRYNVFIKDPKNLEDPDKIDVELFQKNLEENGKAIRKERVTKEREDKKKKKEERKRKKMEEEKNKEKVEDATQDAPKTEK